MNGAREGFCYTPQKAIMNNTAHTTILLLGGFGFLGTNLIRYIEEHCSDKYALIVMDRFPAHPAGLQFTNINNVYDGDFADKTLLDRIFEENKIDLVVHSLSATVPSSVCSNSFDMQANVLPTLQLLESMRQHNVQDILFLSSGGAVYGDVPTGEKGHSETDALYPKSAYGLSKAAIEKHLFQFSELYGFHVLILRPSNPYGPYHYSKKQGIVNIAIEKALANEPFEVWGNGDGKKDYIFVDDLSAIMTGFIEKGIPPFSIVNVGSGELLSVNEILHAVRNAIDKPFAWHYREANDTDVQSFKLDLTQLFTLLPIYQPTPFQQGFDKTLLWYKNSNRKD